MQMNQLSYQLSTISIEVFFLLLTNKKNWFFLRFKKPIVGVFVYFTSGALVTLSVFSTRTSTISLFRIWGYS